MAEKFTAGLRAYTVGLLTLIWAANFLDRQIFAILLQSIKTDMALTDTQLGLLGGLAFSIFYSTFGLPLAYMADRFNRKKLIITALSLFSVMTYICGLAQNYWQLLLARMGVGIGEAGTNPPSVAMISDMYPAEARATPLALFALGANIGIFAAFFLGGWLAQHYGWRATFQVVALPGLALAVLALFTLREPPRGLSDGGKLAAAPPMFEVVKYMFAAKSMRHLIFALALVFAVGNGAIAWVPAYLIRVHDMTTGQIGMALALIVGVGGAGATAICGYWADRLGQRDSRWNLWLLGLIAISATPFLILAFAANSSAWAIVFLAPSISISLVYLGPALAMIHSVVRPEMRAVATALMMFICNMLGLGMGPLLVGLMSDFFTPQFGAFGLAIALMVLSLLSLWGGVHFFLATKTLRQDLAR
mgnify:CR=1 FL=1